ncbi:unnamed protein product, partial [Prorocentrum cordatum]
DVQEVRSPTDVAAYMTKMASYVTKAAYAHGDVLLRRDDKYLHQARVYLKHARPAESLLWATLLGHRGKLLSHDVKAIDPPTFASAGDHAVFQKFLGSPYRDTYPTFIGWLRRVRHTLPEPRPYVANTKIAVAMNFCSLWRGARRELETLGYSGSQLRNAELHIDTLREGVAAWLKNGWTQAAAAEQQPVHVMAQLTLNQGQQEIVNRVSVQFVVRASEEEDLACRRAVCARGPAGTGKTAALHRVICESLGRQERVAIASFTAFVADSFRRQFPGATCDTLHGLLNVGPVAHSPMEMGVGLLSYDLIVVDEVCMLPRWLFDALFSAWNAIDRLPVLLVAGDDGQLAPFTDSGGTSAGNENSPHWRLVDTVTLTEPMRANSTLWPVLVHLRCVWPLGHDFLKKLLHGRVWHRGPLTAQCMRDLFQANPTTVLVCIGRKQATKLNALCQSALLPSHEILKTVLIEEGETPQAVPLQNGLPVRLTRNVQKRRGLINGTAATVRGVSDRTVLLQVGESVEHVRLYVEKGRRFFPIARAFADTLAKRQGSTLPHITISPDVDYVPAAAYVCISRVRDIDDFLFLVRPRLEFFLPAASCQ